MKATVLLSLVLGFDSFCYSTFLNFPKYDYLKDVQNSEFTMKLYIIPATLTQNCTLLKTWYPENINCAMCICLSGAFSRCFPTPGCKPGNNETKLIDQENGIKNKIKLGLTSSLKDKLNSLHSAHKFKFTTQRNQNIIPTVSPMMMTTKLIDSGLSNITIIIEPPIISTTTEVSINPTTIETIETTLENNEETTTSINEQLANKYENETTVGIEASSTTVKIENPSIQTSTETITELNNPTNGSVEDFESTDILITDATESSIELSFSTSMKKPEKIITNPEDEISSTTFKSTPHKNKTDVAPKDPEISITSYEIGSLELEDYIL